MYHKFLPYRRFKRLKSDEDKQGQWILEASSEAGDGDDIRCLKASPLQKGLELTRLEAAFDQDGRAEGLARAEYGKGDSKVVLHAVLKNGFVHGPSLAADAAGEVRSFGRTMGGRQRGRAWGRKGEGVLVFSMAEKDVRGYDDYGGFLVGVGRKSGLFLRGRYLGRQRLMADASEDEKNFRLSGDGSCFLDFEEVGNK